MHHKEIDITGALFDSHSADTLSSEDLDHFILWLAKTAWTISLPITWACANKASAKFPIDWNLSHINNPHTNSLILTKSKLAGALWIRIQFYIYQEN